jgi:hypothetical protein
MRDVGHGRDLLEIEFAVGLQERPRLSLRVKLQSSVDSVSPW